MNTADIDRATIADKRATADSLMLQALRLRREATQLEIHLLRTSPIAFIQQMTHFNLLEYQRVWIERIMQGNGENHTRQ